MTTTRFEIEIDEVGHGTVKIDGVDVSNKIQGITIVSRAGELTRVRVTYGIVTIAGVAEKLRS